MIYPTMTQYGAVMLNPKGRFRTLRDVRAVLDEAGEPIFRASRHSVLFAATIDKELCSLRFFTSEQGSRNYLKLIENEVYMDCNDGGYFDVAIHDAINVESHNIAQAPTISMSENRIAVAVDGLWGFRNAEGKMVVEAIYNSVEDFHEGRAVVCCNNLFGLIAADGSPIIAPIWDEMSYDGSHLCYVEKDGRCGVIDRMGREIVAPEWDWTGEFAHDMLLVEKDGKYGFVDLDGNVAIDVDLENATSFDSNGYATITRMGREYQIDTEKNRV